MDSARRVKKGGDPCYDTGASGDWPQKAQRAQDHAADFAGQAGGDSDSKQGGDPRMRLLVPFVLLVAIKAIRDAEAGGTRYPDERTSGTMEVLLRVETSLDRPGIGRR